MISGMMILGVGSYFLIDKKNMRKAQKVIDDMLDEAEEEEQELEDRDIPQDSAYERYMRELHPELYFGGDL